MVKVKKKKGESDSRLISRFKEEVRDEEIIETYRKTRRHVPPAEEKKLRRKEIEKKIRQQKSRDNY